MTKFFWVLSDGKTVREISWEQFRKMMREDFLRENTRVLCIVHDTEISFQKGKRSFWIRRKPLEEMLKQ